MPANLTVTHRVLTDYTIFARIVPFVKTAEYNAENHILDLRGGIFGFELHSLIQFHERGPRWIQYEIVAGSFRGLKGQLVFENIAVPGRTDQTAVYMEGDHASQEWPPAFVMEQGAEIVLSVTARKMRSYLVEQKETEKAEKPKNGQDTLPQPRSHLGTLGGP
jgi:hypothetical protein